MNVETGRIIAIAEGEPVPKNVVEISPATKELLELVEESPHERGAVWAMVSKYRIPESDIRAITKELKESGKSFPVSGGIAVSFMIPYIKSIQAGLNRRAYREAQGTQQARQSKRLNKKNHSRKLAKARRKQKR